MEEAEIIVIGAGAAGLMAARELIKAGKKVLVLEARDRIGGRINTIYNRYGKLELGAEFIHGDLPVTLGLLNEAGIKYSSAGGEMWHFKNGKFTQDAGVKDWDKLMEKMQQLRSDMELNAFLDKYFSAEKYGTLRNEVRRYVSGYDTADPAKVSVFALRKEWQSEDEDAQHRLHNGYYEMINYLAKEIKSAGIEIILNCPVNKINWSAGKVHVFTEYNQEFKAAKLVVALPLGVLQQTNAIKFEPAVPEYQKAFNQIGFGAIIKVLLRFEKRFWEAISAENFADMGFVLSEEKIPTWWTQAPAHENILTGWLGGNPAKKLEFTSDEDLLILSLESLAAIFNKPKTELEQILVEWHIANWTADPYARGSYAYDIVNSSTARKQLNLPVKDTLYFAGEYLYNGPAMGTVEAALTSGRDVALQILKA